MGWLFVGGCVDCGGRCAALGVCLWVRGADACLLMSLGIGRGLGGSGARGAGGLSGARGGGQKRRKQCREGRKAEEVARRGRVRICVFYFWVVSCLLACLCLCWGELRRPSGCVGVSWGELRCGELLVLGRIGQYWVVQASRECRVDTSVPRSTVCARDRRIHRLTLGGLPWARFCACGASGQLLRLLRCLLSNSGTGRSFMHHAGLLARQTDCWSCACLVLGFWGRRAEKQTVQRNMIRVRYGTVRYGAVRCGTSTAGEDEPGGVWVR